MKKKLYEVKHRDLNTKFKYIIIAETPVEAIKKFIEAVNKNITYDRFEEEGVTSVEDIFADSGDAIIEIVD